MDGALLRKLVPSPCQWCERRLCRAQGDAQVGQLGLWLHLLRAQCSSADAVLLRLDISPHVSAGNGFICSWCKAALQKGLHIMEPAPRFSMQRSAAEECVVSSLFAERFRIMPSTFRLCPLPAHRESDCPAQSAFCVHCRAACPSVTRSQQLSSCQGVFMIGLNGGEVHLAWPGSGSSLQLQG